MNTTPSTSIAWRAPQSVARSLILVGAIVMLTAGHFTVSRLTRPGTDEHTHHVAHVVLQALYLLPVIGAAIWFGLRGGVSAAGTVAVAYSLHFLNIWPDEHPEYVSQATMVVMFFVVGAVAGALVDQQDRERRHAAEIEHRAQRAAIVQGIAGLSSALGFRDDYTRQHSERVADLAVAVGRALDLPADRLELLRLAALVHDVGKIGVPDDILFKPDDLTAEERAAIERHPLVAAEILSSIGGTEEIAQIVLAHHESPDGRGYPRGVKAEAIPTEAAVLRVADVFSALTDKRTYKPAMGADAALASMLALRDVKFDGRALDALEAVLRHRAPHAHVPQRATADQPPTS
jgi:putative nucleotidyltransferase with HDIG domain